MVRLTTSGEMDELTRRLDDAWELSVVAQLPFPLAFALNRIRQEEVAWEFLFKDGLHVLLKYLAHLGISEYLAEGDVPDFDVNDELKKLATPVSDGEWLRLVRSCATRAAATRKLPGLAEAFLRLEEDRRFQVRVELDRPRVATERLGVLSALVVLRNKGFAHGSGRTPEERRAISQHARTLFRVALHELAPVWQHELCAPLTVQGRTDYVLLKGLDNFQTVAAPTGVGPGGCHLRLADGGVLPLRPMAFAATPEEPPKLPLLEGAAELYLLAHLKRHRVPSYLGLKGGTSERQDWAEEVGTLFDRKQVWQTRQDIQLAGVLGHALHKTRESLERFEENNLYQPGQHVARAAMLGVCEEFLGDAKTRMLFLAGQSGTGKTSAVLHWAEQLARRGVPVCLLRGVELPADEVVTSARLGKWLAAYHGYAGEFKDVLRHASAQPGGRFVLIVEGLNEFLGPGRDLEGLWRALNGLVEEHADCAGLKVLVSSRTEHDSIEIYFPHRRPPGFAAPGVFHEAKGHPWLELENFTPDETAAALRAYRMDPAKLTMLNEKQQRALANPNLFGRYADGVLSGEEVRHISERGLTKQFVNRRLDKEPELRRALEQLVGVLGKEKDLVVRLDRLGKVDAKLHAALVADNHRLLHRLREFGLLVVNRLSDPEGNPVVSLALGHDSLFDVLRQRIITRSRRTSAFLLSLSLLGAVWFIGEVGQWGYTNMTFSRVENSNRAVQGLLNEFVSLKVITMEAARTPRVEYAYQAVRAEGAAVEFAREAKWGMLAWATGGLMLILFGDFVLKLIGAWLAEVSGFDSRLRYWRAVLDVRLVGGMYRMMVFLMIFTALLGGVHILAQIYGHTIRRIDELFPIVVVAALTIVLFFTPVLLVRRASLEIAVQGSSVMRLSYFGRKSILWDLFETVLLFVWFGLALYGIHSLTTLPAGKLLWNREPLAAAMREQSDSITQMNLIFERVNKRVNSTFNASPEERWNRVRADSESLLSEPIIPERHQWFITWAFWSTGLAFPLGVLTGIALRACASKRLFPEQWKQPA